MQSTAQHLQQELEQSQLGESKTGQHEAAGALQNEAPFCQARERTSTTGRPLHSKLPGQQQEKVTHLGKKPQTSETS